MRRTVHAKITQQLSPLYLVALLFLPASGHTQEISDRTGTSARGNSAIRNSATNTEGNPNVWIEVDSPYYYNNLATRREWKVWVKMHPQAEERITCVRWELRYPDGNWTTGAFSGKRNERLAPDGNMTGSFVFYDLRAIVKWDNEAIFKSPPIRIGTAEPLEQEFDWNHDGGYGVNYNWCTNEDIITAVHTARKPPDYFELQQNYPNPFNPSTSIRYRLTQQTGVTLTVFDLLGRRIRALVEREQSAGSYAVIWGGRDDNRNKVPSGIYIYQLEAGGFSESRKMLLLQ